MQVVKEYKENLLSSYPKIVEFLNFVNENTEGYDVYLGGGFLRDTLHRSTGNIITPKDVDIFFIPKDKGNKQLPLIPKGYVNYDIDTGDMLHCRDNVGRVVGWFVKDLEVVDVQFIVYKDTLTLQELVLDMDCNINQIMMPVTGEKEPSIYYSKAFKEGHEQHTIEMLHEFDTQRMYERLMRMKSKFPKYALKHSIDDEVWNNLSNKDSKKIKGNPTAKSKKIRSSGVSSPSFID